MMMKNNKTMAFCSEIYHRVEPNPMEIYFIKQFFQIYFYTTTFISYRDLKTTLAINFDNNENFNNKNL